MNRFEPPLSVKSGLMAIESVRCLDTCASLNLSGFPGVQVLNCEGISLGLRPTPCYK